MITVATSPATGSDAAAGCPDTPEQEKPVLDEGLLLKQGFPLRHVIQLSAGLHGKGAEMVRKHREKILKGDAILILVGNRGPGKTQIATAWAGHRMVAGKLPGRYVKCADLIGEIKATFDKKGASEEGVLKKYRTTPYLVIDEFHERGASDWEARTLINLIDHRYDDMKCTVLIANVEILKLTECINPSIIDRANQTGGVINCDWESYR